jgi:peptide deformylase
MAILPITLYPDPVLLRPTEPVEKIDNETRRLVQDMVDTMVHAPGIGLAANQVGVSRRLCVIDLSSGQEPGALHVFINPQIKEATGSQVGEEGCLSFPDITLEIERASQVAVESLGLDGERTTITVEGLLARAILHECEHLDGKTFLRNVSSLKRELVKRQIRKRIKSGDWVEAAAK